MSLMLNFRAMATYAASDVPALSGGKCLGGRFGRALEVLAAALVAEAALCRRAPRAMGVVDFAAALRNTVI